VVAVESGLGWTFSLVLLVGEELLVAGTAPEPALEVGSAEELALVLDEGWDEAPGSVARAEPAVTGAALSGLDAATGATVELGALP
jgi:hypothetical protein